MTTSSAPQDHLLAQADRQAGVGRLSDQAGALQHQQAVLDLLDVALVVNLAAVQAPVRSHHPAAAILRENISHNHSVSQTLLSKY